MMLDRRTFLRWASAAGLTVSASPLALRSARAAEPGYGGPYYLFVHAAGGWDPTLLCDPKGRDGEDAPDPVNTYDIGEIETVGPFSVAPVDGHVAFFERFSDQLLVINGIDTQTNSHETGTRHTWSGSMDPGTPSLAALIAASRPDRPSLAFLSNGGYDLTAGLVAPTRLPDTSTILDLAYPERLDPDDPDDTMIAPSLLARLQTARAERLARLQERATLPRVARAMSVLHEARLGDNELSALSSVLPDDLDDSGNELRRQAQVAMACFKAGVTVSATLTRGGFDTHGNHDASHTPRMQDIVDGVTYAMDEAERQGIADQVVIVVGSDFGRTPWYNSDDGKDHWTITSMMFMGPGIQGGRVIGATDARQVPRLVDPGSLALDDDGIRITPAHIHAALRQHAGLDGYDPAGRWPVGEVLPLFG